MSIVVLSNSRGEYKTFQKGQRTVQKTFRLSLRMAVNVTNMVDLDPD